MDQLVTVLKNSVRKASKIVHTISARDTVQHKGEDGRDIVTAVDLAVEKILMGEIKKKFPGHHILSEETKSDLDLKHPPEHLWIMDPIDGTVNLRYGRNASAISLAYVHKGIVLTGVALNPFTNEEYFAVKGKGSYLNGKKLQVDNKTDLGHALMSMDNRKITTKMKYNLTLLMSLPDNTFPHLRLGGSAVLQICEVAARRSDIYFHTGLYPWDKAVSYLVVQEAGGVTKNFNGKYDDYTTKGAIAGNEVLVDKFIALLKRPEQ